MMRKDGYWWFGWLIMVGDDLWWLSQRFCWSQVTHFWLTGSAAGNLVSSCWECSRLSPPPILRRVKHGTLNDGTSITNASWLNVNNGSWLVINNHQPMMKSFLVGITHKISQIYPEETSVSWPLSSGGKKKHVLAVWCLLMPIHMNWVEMTLPPVCCKLNLRNFAWTRIMFLMTSRISKSISNCPSLNGQYHQRNPKALGVRRNIPTSCHGHQPATSLGVSLMQSATDQRPTAASPADPALQSVPPPRCHHARPQVPWHHGSDEKGVDFFNLMMVHCG